MVKNQKPIKLENSRVIHENNLNSGVFSIRQILFVFNKWWIFFITLVYTFMFIKDISFQTILDDWISPLWSVGLASIFLSTAWMVSKIVLDSNRKSRTGIIFVIMLIALGAWLYQTEMQREVTDLSEFDRLAYFGIIPPSIRAFDRALMIILNWRISPLESKYGIPKLIGFIMLSAFTIVLYLIIDLITIAPAIDPDYKFSVDNGWYEKTLVSVAPFLLIVGVWMYEHWKTKSKKIAFANWSNEKVKVTVIPAYIALVIWFVMNSITASVMNGYIYSLIGIQVLLFLIGMIYSFAKSDLSSRNIAVMVYGMLLTLCWITPYLFNQMYGIKVNTMTMVSFSAIASGGILLLIVSSGRSISKMQSTTLAVLTVSFSIGLLAYAFIRSLSFNLDSLPIDIHELILMLMWLVPIVFTLTGVFSFLFNQISIRSNIIKSSINRKKVKNAK